MVIYEHGTVMARILCVGRLLNPGFTRPQLEDLYRERYNEPLPSAQLEQWLDSVPAIRCNDGKFYVDESFGSTRRSIRSRLVSYMSKRESASLNQIIAWFRARYEPIEVLRMFEVARFKQFLQSFPELKCEDRSDIYKYDKKFLDYQVEIRKRYPPDDSGSGAETEVGRDETSFVTEVDNASTMAEEEHPTEKPKKKKKRALLVDDEVQEIIPKKKKKKLRNKKKQRNEGETPLQSAGESTKKKLKKRGKKRSKKALQNTDPYDEEYQDHEAPSTHWAPSVSVYHTPPAMGYGGGFVNQQSPFGAAPFGQVIYPTPPQVPAFQSFPSAPTKHELFGQYVTGILNGAAANGMDTDEISRRILEACRGY